MAVVACRVDRQIDAILLLNHPRAQVHRARVLHLHVQVHPVHPVRIVMAHHLVVVPQVVVTHPIAAHILEDHLLHVATHRVALRVDRQIDAMALHQDHLQIVANVALRVDLQIDAMLLHQLGVRMNAGPSVHVIPVHRVIVQPVVHTSTAIHDRLHVQVRIVRHVHTVIDQNAVMIVVQVPIDQ